MKTFLRRWALASAGFFLLELATMRTRRELLTDRAAGLMVDLADLDHELRTTDPADLWRPVPRCEHGARVGTPCEPCTATPMTPAPVRVVRVPPLPICLCDHCQETRQFVGRMP